MLMFRKYSPRFETLGEVVAKRYAKKLVGPGRLAYILLALPLAQWMAIAAGVALGLVVYAVGGNYRRHESEFSAQIPILRRLWLLKPAARFLIASTIMLGIAIGQTHWQGVRYALHEARQWGEILLSLANVMFS
ncbi:hypothetical protein DND58_08255 [Pseudomonas syringae pv. pisi]|nr:hypothetical protein DND58_08255 [Pseudomonas syringae pv. pisi]